MRFLVQPTPERLARARPPVRAFLAFAALGLVALVAQRAANGGLTAAGVEAYYLGDGGMPLTALWEEVHMGAFLYGFTLLALGSIAAVCPGPPRLRAVVFGTAVAATLADLFAPFAVVAWHGAGGLRVATFAAAVVPLAALVGWGAFGFGRGGRRG